MSERFSELPEYAFTRLRNLLDGHEPGGSPVDLSVGEPQHAFPEWINDIIAQASEGLGKYPPNAGSEDLLQAISEWIRQRYGVKKSPATEIIALSGTREGLFNAALALCPPAGGKKDLVMMPNPFYQVYAAAAMAAGAKPVYLPATAETGNLPDLDAISPGDLDRASAFYICSPSNPQGAIADLDYWKTLVDLAERHGFTILADECYSEVYRGDPPPGLLEAGGDPERAMVFHSLSKRSNLPGLRSGFAASGPGNIAKMKLLRSYGGSPLPIPAQAASARLWRDEAHVEENRSLYAPKFELAETVFGDVGGFSPPRAGLFFWLPVDDGEEASARLWTMDGIKTLPGAYLARDANGANPGRGHVRLAITPGLESLRESCERTRNRLYGGNA